MASRDAFESVLPDLYYAFFRHRRKGVALFVMVVMATVLLTFLSPKEYRSEGKLFVRLGRENAMLDPTATLGQTSTIAVPQSRESEINSVVEILQSRVLLEKVVDSLGPEKVLHGGGVADEAAGTTNAGMIRQLGAHLVLCLPKGSVYSRNWARAPGSAIESGPCWRRPSTSRSRPSRNPMLFKFRIEGPTPQLCQTVVGKLIDCYLDEHLRLNRAEGSHSFFAEQTDRLREELSRKEGELRNLKNKTGLASPADQRQLMVARIGRLEDDLLRAEAARGVAQAKVREPPREVGRLPDTEVTNETSGFGNEGTDRMRDQFYALQVREKEAQAKYTENHPKMQQIREQIATSRHILDEEERGRRQVTKEPSRLHHQVELALLNEEPALASLDAQAKQMRQQLVAAARGIDHAQRE